MDERPDPNKPGDWEAFEKRRRHNREHTAYMAFGHFLEKQPYEFQSFYKYEMIPGGFQFYYLRRDQISGEKKVPVKQFWFTSEDADDTSFEKI